MALLRFGIKVFKWVYHDSESFRTTPRFFSLIVGIIFWPLILKLRLFVISCFLFLRTIISVFPVLTDFSANKRLVLSAKWCYELFMIALCNLLVKSRNNKGPGTDLCGRPCVDISLSELPFFIVVYWYLSFKNVSNHIFEIPVTP